MSDVITTACTWDRVAVNVNCWRWFRTFWIFHSHPQLLQPMPAGKSGDLARRFCPRTHRPFLPRLRASPAAFCPPLWGCEMQKLRDGLRGCRTSGEFRTPAGHSLPLRGGASRGDSGEGTQNSAPRAQSVSYLAWMHLRVHTPNPGRRLESSAAGGKQMESSASPRSQRSQRSTGNANAPVSVEI